MKRVTTIFLFFLASIMCVHAGEDCHSIIINATRLYEQGFYETARDRFDYCLRHCGENYTDVCNDWIKKCNKKIIEKKQEQNLRIQAEKEAVLRHEREVIERAERREHNRLAFLSVYSDVPGRFSRIENQLKSNLRWTNDSLEAYWFVRVAVDIFEQSTINERSCYRVEAMIEVDNATELDFETKSGFVFDEECCDKTKTDDPRQFVANMIYENEGHHHLFNEIVANIKNLIEVDFDSVQYKLEEKNVVLVYIDCEDSSIQSSSITEVLQNRLKHHLIEFGYSVKNNDKQINAILQNICSEEMGRVFPDKITPINEKGVDKVCYVRIKKCKNSFSRDALEFHCQFIEMATNSVLKICSYPFNNGEIKCDALVTEKDSKRTIEVVADVLAYQLGLLSNNQVVELKKNIRKMNTVESKLMGGY